MQKKPIHIFIFGFLVVSPLVFLSCMGEEPFPLPTLSGQLQSNSPPSVPYNPFPADGATNVIRTLILRWQSDDPDGEKLLFDIFFNIDSVFTLDHIITESHPDTFLALQSELLLNTTYYWKVDVRDSIGNWQFGKAWSFTTGIETNNTPLVLIESPDDGSQFFINDLITFKGSAIDLEDGALSGDNLVWKSNINGIIGSDTLFSSNTLNAGIHTISLKATDTGNKSSSATIKITILDPSVQNVPPSAAILSPEDGTSFGENRTIVFRGSGSDIEDGDLFGEDLIWTSSIDGFLGNDTLLNKSGFSKGVHSISLKATDSGGLSHTATISITITQVFNTAPLIKILEPVNFAPYSVDSLITFSGTAFDVEDGELSGESVIWTSNRDGQIGTGTSFTLRGMSLGFHTIIMLGEDSQGSVGTDQITINITPSGDANQPPVAAILKPSNDEVLIDGTPIILQGSGTDPEDGNIRDHLLRWNSDRDGFLGTGRNLTLSSPSLGKQVITLSVLDSGGKRDSATVTFFISSAGNTPPVARFNIEQVIPPPEADKVTITLDASTLFDPTDQLQNVEVRWDFDNDGSFDSPFTFEKTANYTYSTKNEPHFVRLVVRDGGGLTHETIQIVPEYVLVASGDFEMGSPLGTPDDEQPRHTVNLDPYYMERFEASNWQFAAFLTANSEKANLYFSSQMSIRKLSDGSFAAVEGLENYPVRYVDWNSANSYSQWIQGRLPTEAEWEKTARGGKYLDESKTTLNSLPVRDFPWGTGIGPNLANYLVIGNPFDGVAPTGTYTGKTVNGVQTSYNGSPYGAMDMLGNVAEWVSDWYDAEYYSSSPSSNPEGPAQGEFKVYRGGSFDHQLNDIRISRRFRALPTSRPYNVGIRTVKIPQ